MKFLVNSLKVFFAVCMMLQLNDAKTQTAGQGQVQIFAPNTFAFGQYGDVPVDYSSGLPQVSVPLLKFEDRDISLDISLSYHASGIRVDQEATWVGLGWVLNSGGVITREIRGLPDSYSGYQGAFVNRTSLPYVNGSIPQNKFEEAYSKLASATSSNGTDNGADIFYYNFNGHAGKFFLDENANATLTKYEDFKVQFLSGDYFVITDEKGFKYEFRAFEYTTDLVGGLSYYISAWYLSKISSPAGGEITIEYVSGGLTTVFYQQRCYSQAYFAISPTLSRSLPGQYLFPCINRQAEISGIVPKKIKSSSGNSIEFVTSPNPRLDAEGYMLNNQLDTVVLYNAEHLAISKFKFSYSYFEANNYRKHPQTQSISAVNFLNYRLRLDAVQAVSSTGKLQSPYRFEYFGDNNPQTQDPYTLPYRLSPSQDHWGYYNDTYNVSIFPYNPPSKPFHRDEWNMALGLGIYPGGGDAGNEVVGGGSREPNAEAVKAGALNKIIYPTGGYTSFTFEPHETDMTTMLPLGGGLKLKQMETSDGNGQVQVKNFEYRAYMDEALKCLGMMDNPYYTLFTQSYYSSGYSWPEELIGLGVPENLAYSSERILRVEGTPQLALGSGMNVFYMQVTEKIPGNGYTIYEYSHDQNLLDGSNSGTSMDGLPMPGIFEGVFVHTANVGGYPPYSYVFGSLSCCMAPFPYFINNDWRRGHLKFKEVRSENRDIISQDFIDYDIHAVKVLPGYKVTRGSTYKFFYTKYYEVGGYVKPVKQTSRLYNSTGNYIETVKEFAYNSTGHKQVTESKEYTSKGDVIISKYYYPAEYGDFFYSLKNQNILAPVDTRTYRNNRLISGAQVAYNSSGQPAVYLKSTTSTTDIPFNALIPFTFDTETVLSYNNDKLVQRVKDKSGIAKNYLWGYKNQYPVAEIVNVPENMAASFAYTSFEVYEEKGGWDYYNNSFNNTNDQPNLNYGASITGDRLYNLQYAFNGGIKKTSLDVSKTYKVSVWYLQNEPQITVGHLVSKKITSGPGDWKLLEATFDNSSSIIFPQMDTDSYIDELRLYPADAQMTTYAYKPLIGMVAKCDVNNQATYYEYDTFNRLRLIRDKEGNILKKICYNYAGEVTPCTE